MRIIAETLDKQIVLINDASSHAVTHLSDTPQLEGLVAEVMQKVGGLCSELESIEVDLGRVVGKSDLVETEESDQIVYAKRVNRDGFTRFCKNKISSSSRIVSIKLRKLDPTSYVLVTAFVGKDAPCFPGEEYEEPSSRKFWSCHALAWGTQEIVPGTETKECPW